MTLQDLIFGLLDSAKEEPNIGFVGCKDIYELNEKPNIEYSVFYVTQNQHQTFEDYTVYSLNLFYVDRIDETLNNQLNVQSTGMVVLQNIINRFINTVDDISIDYSILFQPFLQRFKDITSGVYATVRFVVPNIGLCDYE